MKTLTYALTLATLFLLAACGGKNTGGGKTHTAGSHPGYAPGRKGEVKTITVNSKPFTYEVLDGLAIYQGDMILGEASKVEKKLASLAQSIQVSGANPQGVVCDSDNIATFFGWFCGRWGGGVVPYSFKNDWGSDANNATMRSRILAAIAHWEANTNLDFREAGGGVRLEFRNSEGCSSSVGRQENIFGEPQSVRLNMGCDLSAVIHEIGHGVGLFHEQSREDRDSFVQVLSGNIEDGRGHNFNRHVDDAFDTGPYDFESIMHYDCFAFSRNGMPTLQILASGVTCTDVGNNVLLSDGDILATYRMYPPSFEISGVTTGASFPRNLSLTPSYTAPDPIRPAFIQWFVDGSTTAFGSGTAPVLRLNTLSVGAHTLRAKMIISGVVVAERTLGFSAINVNPSVSITEPANGASFCVNQSVDFKASAGDADTPPSFTLPDSAASWRVGSAAPFATGKEVSRTFSPAGSYTITVTATDADGGSASASVNITVVNCTNNPPVANITNPSTNLDVTPGTSDANGYYHQITLQGNASDTEDGTLTGNSLVWTTNRADVQPGGPSTGNQVLGTGTSVANVRLYTTCNSPYFGTVDHLITLTATDSSGNTATKTRLIRVGTLC